MKLNGGKNMKCPCCGKMMELDSHRKIDMFMCYDCGYIEGRRIDNVAFIDHSSNNSSRAKAFNGNKLARFMARHSA